MDNSGADPLGDSFRTVRKTAVGKFECLGLPNHNWAE